MEKYTNQPTGVVEYPALVLDKIKLNSLLDKLKIMFRLSEFSDDKPTNEGYEKRMTILLPMDGKLAPLGVGVVNEEIVRFLNQHHLDCLYYTSKGVKKELDIREFIDPKTLNPLIVDGEDEKGEDEEVVPIEEELDYSDLTLDDLIDTPKEESPIKELIPASIDMEWEGGTM